MAAKAILLLFFRVVSHENIGIDIKIILTYIAL